MHLTYIVMSVSCVNTLAHNCSTNASRLGFLTGDFFSYGGSVRVRRHITNYYNGSLQPVTEKGRKLTEKEQ